MSLSDYSSLTEISDEEEVYTPKTKTRKTKKEQFEIEPILLAPRQCTYSTKALHEQLVEGTIDLNPEYQRDVVWTDTKQSNLIDSLLRNFIIPPVVFAVHRGKHGAETRVCIDGKQRLTSILRFMDGQIPHKDSRSTKKHWYKLTPSNTGGKLLPQTYRQQFSMKQIACVEYEGIDDKAEREIFQRVQLGVALTPAERMQAISSPWAELVRIAVKQVEEEIGNKLEWQSSRGTDFQCLATAIYLIDKKAVTYSTSSTVLETWMKRVSGPRKEFQDKISEVISVFSLLLDDKKNAKTFQKPTRISPVEFIMVLVLINEYMESASLEQLNSGIGKLRADVRTKHVDIRNNGKCNKTMLTFIKDRYPADLKIAPGVTALNALKKMRGPKPRGSKRKREDVEMAEPKVEEESEEEDDDDMPLRSKSKSPVKKASKTVNGIAATTKAKVVASTSSAARRSSTPSSSSSKQIKMDPDSQQPSRPKQNGTVTAPKNDRLAAVRAANANLQSTQLTQTAAATRPLLLPGPSRLSTDMGPPTQSAGAGSRPDSRPQTPLSAFHPPPPSVPPGGGGGQSHPPGGYSDASQLGAKEWPPSAPMPVQQQRPAPPAPSQSAPVTDPRVRSNSSATSLPPRPATSFNGPSLPQAPYIPNQVPAPPVPADSSYRRGPMDGPQNRSSAMPSSSSYYDDDRMDRRRDSRYDDRSGKPPPSSSGYRDRPPPLSPQSPRDRNGGSRGPPPRYNQNGRDRDSGYNSSWSRR